MSKDVMIDQDGQTRRRAGDVQTVDGPRATENRLRIALNTQLGEVANDPLGIDYLGIFSVSNPDIGRLRRKIREVFVDDPAVDSIESIDIDRERADRTAEITVRATADEDEEIIVTGEIE